MGYTIIKMGNNNQIEHIFIEEIEDILYIGGIDENTLVVKWEKNTVKAIKDEKDFEQYYGNFAAGRKAEKEFYRMMTENSYFIEQIDQSQESFSKYINKKEKHQVKRPDFVILGHNICFEIKCYDEKNYKLSYMEHKGLERFKNKTKMDIFLVIYKKNGDDIARDEYDNPIYFIVKNDDVYASEYYCKKTKTIDIDPKKRANMNACHDIEKFMMQSKQQ